MDTGQNWRSHSGNTPREITNGNIITNFDMKVMQRIGTETGFVEKTFATINNTDKERQEDIDFSKVVNDNNNEGYSTPMRMHGRGSPSDPGSGGSGNGNDSGELNNFNLGNGGPNEPGGDEPPNYGGTQRIRNTDDDRLDREFRLVNPRNVTINIFNGKNLPSNPYMALNNSIRRLILARGNDGTILIRVLDCVEKLGTKKFTITHLNNLQRQCSNAKEFDRAIKSALLNWTAGIAHGLVKYGTEGGLDAWRKLYNKYMPLAHDMQNILIRELMS